MYVSSCVYLRYDVCIIENDSSYYSIQWNQWSQHWTQGWKKLFVSNNFSFRFGLWKTDNSKHDIIISRNIVIYLICEEIFNEFVSLYHYKVAIYNLVKRK